MRYRARPVQASRNIAVASCALVALVGVGLLSTHVSHIRPDHGADPVGFNACQAPLKTDIDKADAQFRQRWQDRELQRALTQVRN